MALKSTTMWALSGISANSRWALKELKRKCHVSINEVIANFWAPLCWIVTYTLIWPNVLHHKQWPSKPALLHHNCPSSVAITVSYRIEIPKNNIHNFLKTAIWILLAKTKWWKQVLDGNWLSKWSHNIWPLLKILDPNLQTVFFIVHFCDYWTTIFVTQHIKRSQLSESSILSYTGAKSKYLKLWSQGWFWNFIFWNRHYLWIDL